MSSQKHLSAPIKVLLIICAVLVGLLLGLQIILNSSVVRRAVDRFARERIDGTLSYKDLSFSVIGAFPKLRAVADSVSLTYPHSRFEGVRIVDSLTLSGTGDEADTLASFDRLSLTLAPFRLLVGKVYVDYAAIHGLHVHAHAFSDSTANWQLFRSSEDTTSGDGSLPTIFVKDLKLDRRPDIVYTDEASGLYVDLGLANLSLGGTFRSGSGGFEFKGANLHFDSRTRASFGKFRNIDIPVLIDARASGESCADSLKLRIPMLTARIAHIPLSVSGKAMHVPDSTFLNVKAGIDSLPVGVVLRQYGAALSPTLPYFTTDAKLNMKLEADGWLSRSSIPQLDVNLSIPESSIDYTPRHMHGRLALECAATSSDGSSLDAVLDRLFLSIPGTSVSLSGRASDLLSDNPAFKGRLSASSSLEPLSDYVLRDAGIDAGGNIDLFVDADAHLKDFDRLHFKNATLGGRVTGDKLNLSLLGNGMRFNAFRPRITLASDPRGAGVAIVLDSLYCNTDSSFTARVRDFSMKSVISKMNYFGKLVTGNQTKLSVRGIFVSNESMKAGVRGADIAMLCKKRPEHLRTSFTDTLRRMDFSGMVPPLDSTGRPIPPPDDRLIKVRLDSALVAEFQKWSVQGSVNLGKGFLATPVLPLRTRLGGVKLSFDSNNFSLDTLSLKSGTSDLRAEGKISGIRRFSKHRGSLTLDLKVDSDRLNLNELICAVQNGSKEVLDSAVNAEQDEAFVIDTLENARPERRRRRFLLPPFIDGSVKLCAGCVEYLDLKAQPFKLSAQMYDKVLKLSELSSSFDQTDLNFSGYYSTPTPKDISIGINAAVKNAPVNESLRLVRTYDSLSPILRSIDGKVDMEASLTASLDEKLTVKPSSVGGMARLSGADIYINDIGDLRRITKLLFFKNKDIGHVDDFHVDAVLRDGKLEVYPFYIGADRYKLALQGIQGLDGTMNWYASVLKSPFLIPFGVKVYGNFDKMRFGLATARYLGKKNLPVYTAELDSIRINVAKTIEEVYSQGVKRALRYSRSSVRKARSVSIATDTLSAASLDSLTRSVPDTLSRTSSDSQAATDSLSSMHLNVEKLGEEFKKIRYGKQ